MKSEPIYRERLLRLADFLDNLPEERFDYSYWVGLNWEGEPDLSCGTTACALGWATTIPEFRELGLRLNRIDAYSAAPTLEGDEYDFHSVNKAAAHVFGLNVIETSYLFRPDNGGPASWPEQPDSAASAKTVAMHIRRFLHKVVPPIGTGEPR